MTDEDKKEVVNDGNDLSEMPGAFADSLRRNNKRIRLDRATAIAEDALLAYKRGVEDLEMERKRLVRQRENMLDMSPENTQSLIVAKEFDARGFFEEDMVIGLKIRNIEIKLEVARKRFNKLFGGA